MGHGGVMEARGKFSSLLMVNLDSGASVLGQQHCVALLDVIGDQVAVLVTTPGPHSDHYSLVQLRSTPFSRSKCPP